ncbi:MAG: SRPBCC family protein, partial [Myxococcota bacterium]
STYEMFGLHLRSVLPRTSLDTLAEAPEAEWSLLAHANVLYALAPNVSILVQDSHYVIVQSDPESVDRTRVTLTTVGRPVGEGEGAERRRQYLEANHRFTVATLVEDFELAEEIQSGLATGANASIRLGRYEDAIVDWHRALDARLATI